MRSGTTIAWQDKSYNFNNWKKSTPYLQFKIRNNTKHTNQNLSSSFMYSYYLNTSISRIVQQIGKPHMRKMMWFISKNYLSVYTLNVLTSFNQIQNAQKCELFYVVNSKTETRKMPKKSKRENWGILVLDDADVFANWTSL